MEDYVTFFEDLIKRMQRHPELFELTTQDNGNVEQAVFASLSCQYLPKDFLCFLQMIDGAKFGDIEIYGLDKILDQSSQANHDEFLNKMTAKPNSRLLFFAQTAENNRYCFKIDVEDEKVYFLDTNQPESVISFSSFSEWLDNEVFRCLQKSFIKE